MKKRGDLAEIKAIEYLKKNNYMILTTNFKYGRVGEIDIIAEKNGKTIFFEVKYRSSDMFGLPEESITKKKKEKLLASVNFYCYQNNIDADTITFEIITILGNLDGKMIIKHYKNMSLEL